MEGWDRGSLSAPQAELVARWLGVPELVEDLSWGLTDTKVLKVHARGQARIVKAAGPDNHHLHREITAYASYTRPLLAAGRAPLMLHSSRPANVLVLEYLDGDLVEGTANELDRGLHRQAGQLLSMLHAEEHRVDDHYEAQATQKALSWLDRRHRIDPRLERDIRRHLMDYRPSQVRVVPTHGDWHPRNWVSHEGQLKAIDFGRFDFRPAASDFCRLAVQQWQKDPALESAFLDGYGEDPRAQDPWRIELLREAVGTAVWAFLVGDTAFEAQGHRMLGEALLNF
ncbi:phosphotransferase family enzyme [Arthrobacter sp. SLBN-112]|jgi:thiamine kinase-like enzyme|uniref:phosphotransferase family protein n=1 Tax=Arthrobacter sp. SLBN-112 TaxID=2768452 RepID=UPI00114F5EBF|nr:phosphotransferase [Arthrobacter sp. SLBN-112]TQJ41173.1 phosphotransferase family enzyme [Arthrobacter sp. SLBN-112]